MVVGAGAAGLAAAIAAAGGRAPVLLVERTADGGRKILISGGGRCNVLPATLAPERFVTDSPAHLLRAMLRAWPLPHMVRFFEHEVGVPLALEADTGKLFPRSNRARDVRDGLVELASKRGVRLQFQTKVDSIAPTPSGWTIGTPAGAILASRVIIATGGLSVPATGSDGVGLTIARALGHRIHDTYPALTPLTFEPGAGNRQTGNQQRDDAGRKHPAPHGGRGRRPFAPCDALCTRHLAPRTALCTQHAAPRTWLPAPCPALRPLAPGPTPGPRRRTHGGGVGRFLVHAPRLQRPGRSGHLTPVRAQ